MLQIIILIEELFMNQDLNLQLILTQFNLKYLQEVDLAQLGIIV